MLVDIYKRANFTYLFFSGKSAIAGYFTLKRAPCQNVCFYFDPCDSNHCQFTQYYFNTPGCQLVKKCSVLPPWKQANWVKQRNIKMWKNHLINVQYKACSLPLLIVLIPVKYRQSGNPRDCRV